MSKYKLSPGTCVACDRRLCPSLCRFQNILNNSPAVTFTCKPKGDFAVTFISSNVKEVTGFLPDDFINDAGFWKSRIHKAERDRVLTHLEQVKEQGHFFQEYRWLCKNGQYRWMRDELHLVRDSNGSPVEIVGNWQDISHLKKKECSLDKKELHLQMAERIAHVGTWKRELETNLFPASQETLAILGLPLETENLSHELLMSLIHPDDRDFVLERLEDALQNASDFSIEYRIVRPSGELRHLFSQGKACFDRSGKPLHLSGITIDISERRKNEMSLFFSQQTNNALLNAVPDGLLLLKLDGTVMDLNKEMAQRLNSTRQELLGRNLRDIFPLKVAEGRARALAEMVRTKKPFQFVDSRDGLIFENFLAPVFDVNGNVIQIAAILRDITEKKKHEQQLQDYQKELRTLSAELTLVEEQKINEIIRSLHDNVGPLLSLAGLRVDQLKSADIDVEKKQSLEDISSLIKQSVAAIRTVVSDLRPPVLNNLPFAASLKWLAENFLEKNGILFTFCENGERHLLSDNGQMILFHAARELLINIIKHAGATQVDITLSWYADYMCVGICDNGVGFNWAEPQKDKKDGGFGLFSVRERLFYLNGDIQFEPHSGQGTKVTLTIPLSHQTKSSSVL